jgi:hypothetical protein
VGGGIYSLKVDDVSFIWLLDLLIKYFDFILNLCIFLKILICQLIINEQKNSTFLP